MKETTISKIKNILETYTEPQECVDKIREIVDPDQAPDFSKIKDGETFTYRGVKFIRLGEEQGGILCITAKPWKEAAFDTNSKNNFKISSIRKDLRENFLPKLKESGLLPYTMDLTADNGDDSYGTDTVLVGLLSDNLYRKYRKFIPLFGEWMWTCTPWSCNSGNAISVRYVHTSGVLSNYNAGGAIGVVPACIFSKNQ